MNKLLPCPFCGEEANIIKSESLLNGFISYQIYHSNNGCPISGFLRTGVYELEREAIEAWNTRKPTEKIKEELHENIEGCMNGANDVEVAYWNRAIEKAIEIVEKGGME